MVRPERQETKKNWNSQVLSFWTTYIQDILRELVSRIVEKLAQYLAGPDCGEHAVGHMLDEAVGDGAAELAFKNLVNYVLDGDALFSWPCDGSFESNKLFAVEMKLLHPWSVVM